MNLVKGSVAVISIGILFLLTLWSKYKNINLKKINIDFNISYIKLFFISTFLLGCFSIIWSVNYSFTIEKMALWIMVMFSAYSAYHINLKEDILHRFSFYLVIAIGIIAIIGIMQYLFDFSLIPQRAFPSSTFGNKNYATHPIVLIFPLAIYIILSKKTDTKDLWIISIFTALIISYVFYTSTLAAWISISIEIILIAIILLIIRKDFTKWGSWNKNKTIISLVSFFILIVLINLNSDGFSPFW